MRIKGLALVTAAIAFAGGLAGCRVHVDKDANGQEKTVQVDTPFGGVHVNTDQITASDLGLPIYPGAELANDDKGKHKSADVHMGFGEWQMRVRAVTYDSADSREQVVAFYKKAMARYGDVLTCQNGSPVGTPTSTAEGLTCAEHGDHDQHFQFNGNDYSSMGGFELKAGSRRHQHVLGFDKDYTAKTRFSLVALDLPAAAVGDSEKSD